MSTSPSWFDKDKFSRLVKKVGPKTAPSSPPSPDGASQPVSEADAGLLQPEKKADLPEKKAELPVLEKATRQPLPEKKVEPAPPVKEPEAPAPQKPAAISLPVKEVETPAPQKPVNMPMPEKQFASLPLPERMSGLPLPGKSSGMPLPFPEKPKSTAVTKTGMMTSQSVSLVKVRPTPTPISTVKTEPVRLPTTASAGAPAEARQTSSLPRRTSQLPALKDVFEFEIPAASEAVAPAETTEHEALPAEDAVFGEPLPETPLENEYAEDVATEEGEPRSITASGALAQSSEDLAAAWERIEQLNHELALAAKDRDDAINESIRLQGELRIAESAGLNQDASVMQTEELERTIQERDEALSESNNLREELRQTNETIEVNAGMTEKIEELSHAAEERDRVRGDYVELREQYENLKQEQIRARKDSGQGRAEQDRQLDELRKQVADRDKEIKVLMASLASAEDSHKQEINALKEQPASKDDASVAHRGLALSQKALQETREALRVATESATNVKSSLENLKRENSTLVQQNMLLQAQHDQVSRELSSVKAKLAAKH